MQDLPLPADPRLRLSPDHLRRVELTVSCRDADEIPKAARAGEVRNEDGARMQVMHDGSRVLAGAYHGDWMIEIIRRLRGHHEPQEELVVHRILERLRGSRLRRLVGRQPPVIVELGSFWAHYTIWALRRTGGRGFLVEPDPSNLDVGRRNLRANGLEATVVRAAVGGAHGTRTRLVCESDSVERDLPVVTVAGLMDDHDLEQIDLLLADVQGPEDDVLSRAAELLRTGRIRFLVISTHHRSISGDPRTHERCLAMVTDAGAHVIAAHTVGESFSGDGLIAASTDPDDRAFTVEISRCRVEDSLFGED
jgi:FkbM family methyltransferase